MQPFPQQPYGQPPPYVPPPPKSSFPVWAIVILVIAGLGVLSVGVFAALGIYGTRRYLAAAKTAEAKNSIGAIARGARAAWEREAMDPPIHQLCKSATPVPAAVPKGNKYMPLASGGDFDTGDAQTGWKCLRFTMTSPIYYQYSYNQGGGYLAPSVNPGPTGFEAAARGDINGDGVTSLFVLTGTPSATSLVVAPSIYIENEFE